ncbi:MAG: UPF0175 family protein [bacterium]
MTKLTTAKVKLPKEVEACIKSLTNNQYSFDDRIRIAIATGLFVEKEITLAQAAKLAGMSLYEYLVYLRLKGVSAHEYTEAEFEMDKEFVRNYLNQ